MITRFDMFSVVVHGCPLGITNAAGEPILKLAIRDNFGAAGGSTRAAKVSPRQGLSSRVNRRSYYGIDGGLPDAAVPCDSVLHLRPHGEDAGYGSNGPRDSGYLL